MNDLPRVCVMIPTYNQANYVVKAIASALAQDYPNIEIVIADDQSTDNTAEVIQQFIGHAAIKYKRNVTNQGRVGNYRKCLYDYADADWVINLDGDDYFTNTQFISQAMNAIQAHGNEALFYQGIHIFKLGETETFTSPKMEKQEECITSKNYFLGYFERNYFSHLATLYNRQLAIDSNFYELNILSTDIFSFLRLCLKYGNKKVIISKNIAGVWLQHESNISKSVSFKTHWSNFRLYIKLYHEAIKKGYGRSESFKWLLKAGYNYWAGYMLKFIAKK